MHKFASDAPSSTIDLSTAMDIAMPIFVLIDPMLGEPLPHMLAAADSTHAAREVGWQRSITAVPLAANVSLPSHQHPYLVALTGPDDELLAHTMMLAQNERLAAQKDGLDGHGGNPHRIGGWIQTSMHVGQLAEQLSSMFQVNTVAITHARYMRQIDRRVLSLLRHVVGDARLSAQFGRLHSWTYVDVLGTLTVLRSANDEAIPLRLSSAEWAMMESGELIHRAIAQWLGETARAGEPATAIALEKIIPNFLFALSGARQAARKWPQRFAGTADLTACTALSILHPNMFDSNAVARFMDLAPGSDDVPDLLRYLHPDLKSLITNPHAQLQ